LTQINFNGPAIREKRRKLRWSAERLAVYLQVNKENIYKWEKGKKPQDPEDYLKVMEWLKTPDEQLEPVPREVSETSLILMSEPRASYLEKRRAQKNSFVPFMVPLVPVKAQAGYAKSYSNSDFINDLELYPILPGIDPRGAVWRFFEVEGDSMETGLYDTDLVLVSMVPPEDWKDVKKGQVYVVVTDEAVYIKLIYPKDAEHWILASSNPRHKQRTIAIKDVKELWRYRRHVTNKIQWPKNIKQ
jgi:phage repressor protein C with HTH and peptisase S24 domain